jgi:hypothetical protein
MTITNPPGNRLSPGVAIEKVELAIQNSGYPLQTLVASQLRSTFRVVEEWAYKDRNTEETRTLDLWASSALPLDMTRDPHRVRPHLDLLIECKQSELPYVFFHSESQGVPNFPSVAGLKGEEVALKTDDSRNTWTYPVLPLFGLHKAPYLLEPPVCSTISKCARKGGGDLVLSGSDAYNGIVMPLMSATDHFHLLATPPLTARYFEPHLVVPLAILDSPMIGVQLEHDSQQLAFIPWIRILRHEPSREAGFLGHRGNLFAIDVIHKDFLSDFLDSWLMPFALRFQELAWKHDEVLATGKGFVPGLGQRERVEQLEEYLTPRR